jgi:hypothetical protein
MMRTLISISLLSFAVLIGGALLAAFTPNAKQRSLPRSDGAVSIDTRELTDKATDLLPLQFYDAI